MDNLTEFTEASDDFKRLNGLSVNALPCPPVRVRTQKGTLSGVPSHQGPSEEEFQQEVIAWLQSQGFLVHAERKARTSKGWVTPVQGASGWPDICAVKGSRLLFIELKSEAGKATPEQVKWMLELSKTGAEVYCWTPTSFRVFKEKEESGKV